MMIKNTIVVTRHPALVELLLEEGIIFPDTPVYEHATPEIVKGRDVIGVLPLHLAALCNSIAEVKLDLTPEMRGKELDLQTLKSIACEIVTYKVNRCSLYILDCKLDRSGMERSDL